MAAAAQNTTHSESSDEIPSQTCPRTSLPCFGAEFSHAVRVGICFKLSDPDGDGSVPVTKRSSSCARAVQTAADQTQTAAGHAAIAGRRFLQHIVKLKEFDNKWWRSLECFIEGTRLDKLDLDLDAATRSQIHQVFSSHAYDPGSRHYENEANKELKDGQDMGFWPRVRRQVSDQRLKLLKMYNRAKESRAPYEEVVGLSHVQSFLELLADILHRTSCGLLPKKAAFMNLFQRYARLCRLNLSPGDTITREMTVLGSTVKSMPDFQFRSDDESRNEFLVITVGETHGDESPRPSSAKRRRQVLRKAIQHSPRTAHRLSDDDTAIAELGCELSGRHACQLLLELPHSAMNAYGRGTCVLGLIIETTKVRLTCLEMKTEHLKKIESSTEPIDDEEATLHYTRAYDMLNRNDRKHLDYILLTLAFLNPHMST